MYAIRSYYAQALRPLVHFLENPPHLLPGPPDPEADQSHGGAPVEDHHQDQPVLDDREVHVVPLSLVEEDRELLFADQRRQPPRGRGSRQHRAAAAPSHRGGLGPSYNFV